MYAFIESASMGCYRPPGSGLEEPMAGLKQSPDRQGHAVSRHYSTKACAMRSFLPMPVMGFVEPPVVAIAYSRAGDPKADGFGPAEVWKRFRDVPVEDAPMGYE